MILEISGIFYTRGMVLRHVRLGVLGDSFHPGKQSLTRKFPFFPQSELQFRLEERNTSSEDGPVLMGTTPSPPVSGELIEHAASA